MASTEQIAKEYFDKGMALVNSNNLESGIDNLNMAKTIYQELDDKTQYIFTLRGLAIAYGNLGYDSKMLYKCLDGFTFADKNAIRGAKHLFYTIICNRYMYLGDYDSALNYGKMAIHDLEEYGNEFENTPHAYLVAYLNLAYCYLHMNKFKDAEAALSEGARIATENNAHHHDLSLSVLNANLHHRMGDNDYVYNHIDELVNSIKNNNVTIVDYLEDLKILIETFCSMKEFERAEAVASNLNSYGIIAGDDYLKMEAAKFYMQVYKASGEKEKYHSACVSYAETSIHLATTISNKHLQDMDTAIALSIADTPAELL